MADRADGIRLVLHRDLVRQLDQPRHAAPGIAAHRHRRGAGMALLAGDRAFDPAQPLAVGDDADIEAFRLEDRALLDMQLEHRMHLAGADLFLADPADPLQFVAEAFSLGIRPVIGPAQIVPSGEDARGQHRGREPCAFLVGPVDQHDRAAGLDLHRGERAQHLETAEHAEHAVVFAARRLGVEMRAHVDRERLRVGAGPGREHVAQLVDAHRAACRLAPGLEQRPAFGIGIGQGLAVVAAGKILNIYPRKGAIVEGADADIVVWDPKISKTITPATHHSVLDYNVFEGVEVTAQARYTLSRGEVIWAWGQNSQPQPGRGRFVPRPAFSSAAKALSQWKALTAPKMIQRDPLNIPAGI